MSANLSSRPTSCPSGTPTPTPGSGLLGRVIMLFHYVQETPYCFFYSGYTGLYAQGLFVFFFSRRTCVSAFSCDKVHLLKFRPGVVSPAVIVG